MLSTSTNLCEQLGSLFEFLQLLASIVLNALLTTKTSAPSFKPQNPLDYKTNALVFATPLAPRFEVHNSRRNGSDYRN